MELFFYSLVMIFLSLGIFCFFLEIRDMLSDYKKYKELKEKRLNKKS